MSEKTFRCGWRVVRELEPRRPDLYQGAVLVRRGEFRMMMPAEFFDSMTDEVFNSYVSGIYRDAVFQQMQADLGVLARQLVGEVEAGLGVAVVGVPYDDVKEALYRWQKADRDTEDGAT